MAATTETVYLAWEDSIRVLVRGAKGIIYLNRAYGGVESKLKR